MHHTEREVFETYHLTQHSTCIELGAKQAEKIINLSKNILNSNFPTSMFSVDNIVALAAIISAQTAQLNISWEKNLGQIKMKATALNAEDKDK